MEICILREMRQLTDGPSKQPGLASSLTNARNHQLALQNHMKELRRMIHILQAWPVEIWRKKLKEKVP